MRRGALCFPAWDCLPLRSIPEYGRMSRAEAGSAGRNATQPKTHEMRVCVVLRDGRRQILRNSKPARSLQHLTQ